MDKTEFMERIINMNSKTKKKLILISLAAVVIITLFTITWLTGYNNSKNKTQREIEELKAYIEQLENDPIVLEPIRPEIVMKVLNEHTAEISELATNEYLFTNSGRFTDKSVSWLPDWVTEKSFLMKWDGVIKAGIDLSKISVTIEENIIKITLPRADILSYEVKKVEVLDEKNNIFNPISATDTVNFLEQTKEAMKLRAVGNGLLDQAQINAEKTIESLIRTFVENIENYTIEFSVNYN